MARPNPSGDRLSRSVIGSAMAPLCCCSGGSQPGSAWHGAVGGCSPRSGPPLPPPVPSRVPAGYPWHWSRST
jgi:hypothetical protein